MTSVPHVSLEDIRVARERIRPHVVRTPLIAVEQLSDRLSCKLYLKLEMFQRTGSFKSRGVFNALTQLSDAEKSRGVITISSGNHAQALAYGASKLGIPSTIVMPSWAVPSKVASARGYGAEIVQTDGNLLETMTSINGTKGCTVIPPFDDPRIIAGAGTIALEIAEDVPNVDLVLAGIGGGGLISGVAAGIKRLRPTARLVGVEPEGAPAMSRSLAAGKPDTLDKVDTIADGLAAPFAGTQTFAHVKEFVDDVVLVNDAEILAGMRVLMEQCKVYVEPSAAAAFGALLAGKVKVAAGGLTACVLSGGNVDTNRVRELLGS